MFRILVLCALSAPCAAASRAWSYQRPTSILHCWTNVYRDQCMIDVIPISKRAKQLVKSIETTFEIIETLKHLNGTSVTELKNYLDLVKIQRSQLPQHAQTGGVHRQEQVDVQRRDSFFWTQRVRSKSDGNRHNRKERVDDLTNETGKLANHLIEEHGRGSHLHQARGENAVQVGAYTWTRVFSTVPGLEKLFWCTFLRTGEKKFLTFIDYSRTRKTRSQIVSCCRSVSMRS